MARDQPERIIIIGFDPVQRPCCAQPGQQCVQALIIRIGAGTGNGLSRKFAHCHTFVGGRNGGGAHRTHAKVQAAAIR